MAEWHEGSITLYGGRDKNTDSMYYTLYDYDGSIAYQGYDEEAGRRLMNQKMMENDNAYRETDEYKDWKAEHPEEAAQQEAEAQRRYKEQGLIEDTPEDKTDDKPAEETPSDDQPVEGTPSNDQPTEETPEEEKDYEPLEEDYEVIEENAFKEISADDVNKLYQDAMKSANAYKKITTVDDYNFVEMDPRPATNDETSTGENPDQSADDYSLIPPINPTDLILHHEHGKNLGSAAKKNDETKKETSDESPQAPKGENPINTEGIFWPLVNLNGLMLDKEAIYALKITVQDILPRLSLYVVDKDKKLRRFNRPTANNHISVILVPPFQGVYKNMVATFYCDFCEEVGEDYLHYEGDYHCIELNKQVSEAIIFPGCTKKDCERPENKKPTTWEYLHVIAENTGYGYASTENCHTIEDKLPRLRHGQTYLDFIKEHIQFGGTNEDEIFDVWLDLHGNICLLNLPWVFNYDLTFRNLAVKASYQPKPADKDLPPSKVKEVHRTITNFNHNADYMADLYIENYQEIDHNYKLMKEGLDWTFWGRLPEGSPCSFNETTPDKNSFTQVDIQCVENSPSGSNLSEYSASQVVVVKDEYNPYQTERQKVVRDNYLRKLRNKYLVVELKEPNFGLERGQLINVSIFAFDPQLKKKLIESINNIAGGGDGNPANPQASFDKEKIAMDSEAPVPNYYLNGIYYIDYVEIVWDPYNHMFPNPMDGKGMKENIKQYLYLIKKNAKLAPADPATTPILDETRFPGLPETKGPEDAALA